VAGSGWTSVGLYDIAADEDKIIVATDKVKVFDALSGELLHASTMVSDSAMYLRPVLRDGKAYFVAGNSLYVFNVRTYALVSYNLRGKNPSLPNLWVTAAVRFDAEGNLYIGTTRYFFSVDEDGDLRWLYDTHDEDISFRSTPCIDMQNRSVYVGTKADEKSKFVALNMDTGALKWEYNTASDVYSSPLLRDGRIYFGSETRKLHVLTTDGIEVYTVNLNEDVPWPSPVTDSQGILYIGGMQGFVYAIRTA
jgi:outer membrane protein assembly factor BamB